MFSRLDLPRPALFIPRCCYNLTTMIRQYAILPQPTHSLDHHERITPSDLQGISPPGAEEQGQAHIASFTAVQIAQPMNRSLMPKVIMVISIVRVLPCNIEF